MRWQPRKFQGGAPSNSTYSKGFAVSLTPCRRRAKEWDAAYNTTQHLEINSCQPLKQCVPNLTRHLRPCADSFENSAASPPQQNHVLPSLRKLPSCPPSAWMKAITDPITSPNMLITSPNRLNLRVLSPNMSITCRSWRSNPSRKCSQERLTRGTVISPTRKTAHRSGYARCGAGACCSAMKYQSLRDPLQRGHV